MAPISLLFVFTVVFTSYSAEAVECEDGWLLYKDEVCIKAFTSLLAYDEAKLFCTSQGNEMSKSTLVMVKDADMQNLLANYTHDIVDNIWLGGKYDNTSGNFIWDDGEPLTYTNWQDGYPRNITDSDSCIELRPTNAKLSTNSDGKWADVLCQKRNLVMCQRDLPWTLEDAVTEIKRIRKYFEEELEFIKSKVIPVGSIYIEYSNQPSPLVLWPTLSWEDISETYAGLFFRTSGGDAERWGTTQTECAPRITSMRCATGRNAYTNPLTIPSSGWSDYGKAGEVFTYGDRFFEGLGFYTEDCEVRPKNQAIRIWKRVA